MGRKDLIRVTSNKFPYTMYIAVTDAGATFDGLGLSNEYTDGLNRDTRALRGPDDIFYLKAKTPEELRSKLTSVGCMIAGEDMKQNGKDMSRYRSIVGDIISEYGDKALSYLN